MERVKDGLGLQKSRDSSSSVGVVASFSPCSAVSAGMRQQDWLEIVTPTPPGAMALPTFSKSTAVP